MTRNLSVENWLTAGRYVGWALIVVAFVRLEVAVQGWDLRLYHGLDYGAMYAASTSDPITGYQASPLFGQLAWPLTLVPFRVAYTVSILVSLGCLVYLVGPWAGFLLIPYEPAYHAVATGNVFLLMAVVVVLGFRYPALWAFNIVAKVTGGVCLLWFVARREWRSLAIALGTLAALVAASVLLAPGQWASWLDLMRLNASSPVPPQMFGVPLAVRLPVAAVLVVYAARTDRQWLVVPAFVLAQPYIGWPTLTMLLAVVPLWRSAERRDDHDAIAAGATTLGSGLRPAAAASATGPAATTARSRG